jgi:hypothetical protein
MPIDYGYIRQIIMTIEDDSDLIRNELRLAEKYPDNTTIVHMDKNRNLGKSFIAYSPSKLQGIKLTFLTLEFSPVV